MVTRMKTTVDLADGLVEEVKRYAAAHQMTFREVLEWSLRRILVELDGHEAFQLRDASVDGRGLQPEFRDGGWDRIRDTVYEGHGA
jgi:hypothetical protein